MTAFVNITDYSAGDSLIADYTVKDGATQYRDPKSLVGAVVTWVIEKRRGTQITELLALASDDPSPKVVITDAANGVVRVTLEAGVFTQTGDFHHKLKVDISGVVETVASGRFFSK